MKAQDLRLSLVPVAGRPGEIEVALASLCITCGGGQAITLTAHCGYGTYEYEVACPDCENGIRVYTYGTDEFDNAWAAKLDAMEPLHRVFAEEKLALMVEESEEAFREHHKFPYVCAKGHAFDVPGNSKGQCFVCGLPVALAPVAAEVAA